jgi:hypothetical protein
MLRLSIWDKRRSPPNTLASVLLRLHAMTSMDRSTPAPQFADAPRRHAEIAAYFREAGWSLVREGTRQTAGIAA